VNIKKNTFIYFILILCNFLYASEVVIQKIDCGNLNVGQVKKVKIPIRNDQDQVLRVKNLFACCGNPKPTLNMTTIPVGATAELVQEIRKVKVGYFKVRTSVSFENPNLIKSFIIEGDTNQPISAKIGWSNNSMKCVDYKEDEVVLDKINYNGSTLHLCLSVNNDILNLYDNFVSLKSNYFVLSDDSSSIKNELPNSSLNLLNLKLKNKNTLPIGELRDTISIEFKDRTVCNIPICFRSIGDLYGETSVINLGKISSSKEITKTFNIYFINGLHPWKDAKWEVNGKLSDAIDVSVEKENKQDTLKMTITVNDEKIPRNLDGFLSSRIVFFENKKNNINTVKLLLYGYR